MKKTKRPKIGAVVTMHTSKALGVVVKKTASRASVMVNVPDGRYTLDAVWSMPWGSIKDTGETCEVDLDRGARRHAELLKRSTSLHAARLPDYINHPLHFLGGGARDRFNEEMDRKRQKVYDAERTVKDYGQVWSSFEGCAAYFHELVRCREFVDVWGTWPQGITFRQTRKGARRSLAYHNGTIAMTSFKERIVLHELAHILTGPVQESHGRMWRAIYLDLMETHMSTLAADRMRAAFIAAGLDYTASAESVVDGVDEVITPQHRTPGDGMLRSIPGWHNGRSFCLDPVVCDDPDHEGSDRAPQVTLGYEVSVQVPGEGWVVGDPEHCPIGAFPTAKAARIEAREFLSGTSNVVSIDDARSGPGECALAASRDIND